MSRATLSEVLQPALKDGYAVAGVVCLGWEDIRAYAEAAEIEKAPLILQAGPGCREHTPLPVLAAMFGQVADAASVPIVLHLDHGYSAEECKIAIECGFTSVMYDGSRKPLRQNIDETAAIAETARKAGVSCEGEIGFVGYSEGEHSAGTIPEEAAQFAKQTGVDAMAISIGNVHLQQDKSSELDVDALRAIEAVCQVPLVIHGGSGVSNEQRKELATNSSICKFNIGTELRMIFGQSLRDALANDANMFDRNSILKQVHDPLQARARAVFSNLGGSGRYA